MKKDAKKSIKPAAKANVKVGDIAPKKDAKGGKTKNTHFGYNPPLAN